MGKSKNENYNFYMTEDNAGTYLVAEDRSTDTWEAAVLDWDISDAEAREAIKSFLAGEKEPYTSEDGITWVKDKENLLPECAKFFGFRELD